jgi:hypothetical protein
MPNRAAIARLYCAFVLDTRLQTVILLIAVHVRDDRDASQPPEHARRITGKVSEVIATDGELVLGRADSTANPQILKYLEIYRSAGYSRQLGAEARNNGVRSDVTFRKRLETDEHACVVRHAAARAACETDGCAHCRIRCYRIHCLQENTVHALERCILVRQNLPQHAAAILLREEALRYSYEQICGQADCAE